MNATTIVESALAPEQVQGKTPDNRCDIFSYGVLAYELLTGERPFEKDSISATLYSILHDDAKPITLPPHVCPHSLRRLIEACMDKDPDKRPETMGEILKDLDRTRAEMRSSDTIRDFEGELRNVAPSTSLSIRKLSGLAPSRLAYIPADS